MDNPIARSTGIVFDIKKYAIHDGPGIRTTVYLKGCPLACAWCHNPEGQAFQPQLVFRKQRCIQCDECIKVCPQGTAELNSDQCTGCGRCVEVCPSGAREIIGRSMTVDQVMAEVEKDIVFYDESGGGVTFSGGEPLARPDFLSALLQACKALDLHTAVDTTGYTSPQTLKTIMPLVDLFLYDLKAVDDTLHRRFTGVSNLIILENLQMLVQAGKTVVIRVPIIPGINDDEQHLDQLGRLVANLNHIHRVDILAYHPMATDKYGRLGMAYTLANIPSPNQAKMEQIASGLKKHGLQVTIGG